LGKLYVVSTPNFKRKGCYSLFIFSAKLFRGRWGTGAKGQKGSEEGSGQEDKRALK
jgi:hypothetical protein